MQLVIIEMMVRKRDDGCGNVGEGQWCIVKVVVSGDGDAWLR